MEPVSYSFAIPLDHSTRLEVSFKFIDEDPNGINGISQLSTSILKDYFLSLPVELLNMYELPGKIGHAIQTAQSLISKQVSHQQSFMVSTSYGFQLLYLNQIICFYYLNEKRLWTVSLTDQTKLVVKRYKLRKNILNYSPNFIQIKHHQIINLDSGEN